MREGRLGWVAETQGWGLISWDFLGNMKSTGTNGGCGSECRALSVSILDPGFPEDFFSMD